MFKALHLFPIFLFFLFNSIYGQITGKITGNDGEPLPFASIYVKGTSTGTTSNIEGAYSLNLQPGTYALVFQYVGYQQKIESVTISNTSITLDIQLNTESIELDEVVINANAEDPAYAVIRKAIAKRKYFRDQVKSYDCDVYIKGKIKFLEAPESFMGVDIGNMGGTLDSNRQGIIYLSESLSKLSFKEPDLYKEEMISSKVSGNDNGFGFNRASDMDFNFYKSYATLGRQIISPIANNALSYYKYRLVGTLYDEEKRLINKIELIPKRSEDPVYRGYIYIIEDLWNIQSIDVFLLESAVKLPAFDTLFIKQVQVPVEEPDVWRIFSQTISFSGGLFGFKIGGNFTAVYSNYILQPNFVKGFFDNEVFKVTEGANDKDLKFWDTIRPIPLTMEESVDYVRKDSLQVIRKSKTYLDSIDAKNNKFKTWDLLFGYDYNNSYERKYFEIKTPLSTIQVNTVQGYNLDLQISYRQEFDEYNMRWYSIQPQLSYGFADMRLRGNIGLTYNFNRTHNTRLRLKGGVTVSQFNDQDPISPTLNSSYTLIARENYMKLYEKSFGNIGLSHELFNGLYMITSLEWAERRPLENRFERSLFGDEDEAFLSNNPLNPLDDAPAFETNQSLIFELQFRLRINQKYITYPNRKFNIGSKWPDILLKYRKGIAAFSGDVNFDQLSIGIRERYVPAGLLGYFQFFVEGGTFLNSNALQFMDAQHFNGNQTIIGNPERYLNSFMMLPYYDYSTFSDYFQAHFQHHFESFLLDKIPGIRKLGWSTVIGASFLHTLEKKDYLELSVGFDKIGFGAFRLFRFDLVAAHPSGEDWSLGFMIGLSVPIN